MQQKLDSFFKIIPKYDERNKKCFRFKEIRSKDYIKKQEFIIIMIL